MNTSILLDAPVGALVAERPSRSLIFEAAGIDYCCAGSSTLRAACTVKGLDAEVMAAKIIDFDSVTSEPEVSWVTEPLTAICNHIEATHHAFLKASLPRLLGLTEKVKRAHGTDDPRLVTLNVLFLRFHDELTEHMNKEEYVLFPMCRALDMQAVPLVGSDNGNSLPSDGPSRVDLQCCSIRNPIRVMMEEHDDAGAALAEMRALTDGFRVPLHACPTYRAMLHGLSELEQDMHTHVHLENSVLFPRASDKADSTGS